MVNDVNSIHAGAVTTTKLCNYMISYSGSAGPHIGGRWFDPC